MYKLQLCLRYLRSRAIAYFAVLGVALCVAMMLIAVSVMNGFLDKIEHAAKGLFGDIVIDTAGQEGVAYYDEFIAKMKRDVPEVEAASPFILSYGALRIPGQPHYREGVQVAGIRLPEHIRVTDFAEGLHFQKGCSEPNFDPPGELLLRRLDEESAYTYGILQQKSEMPPGQEPSPEQTKLLQRLRTALSLQADAADNLINANLTRRKIEGLKAQIRKAREEEADPKIIDVMMSELDRWEFRSFEPPENRLILGLGISGLSFRTSEGQIVRNFVPGHKVVLYVFPLGRGASLANIQPNVRTFSVVDDCRTDVSSVDSTFVYVPFETLQELNRMGPDYDAETGQLIRPGRCSQIHVRASNPAAGELELRKIARKIERAWVEFTAQKQYSEAANVEVFVSTWRQRQNQLISQIESQRTLVVIMFGVISMVSVVLIFVIFYTIVVQKTKDIGILKAVGASGWGVAGIFLAYGATVALVGSILGAIGGWFFVRNINPIHDWVGETFGLTVWRREWFIFDKIPNEVRLPAAATIVVAAIIAGLIGALIPAIRAARMQPVEALRYE
ncbi:MAG: FtsX-like permease family protein [Phycisphaerae bacterium]|nr:FtsX-like permease family protein [Phycisphaerae bacterium]